MTNFFSVERLALEKPGLPLHRMRWLEPGDRLDAGDRTLHRAGWVLRCVQAVPPAGRVTFICWPK